MAITEIVHLLQIIQGDVGDVVFEDLANLLPQLSFNIWSFGELADETA